MQQKVTLFDKKGKYLPLAQNRPQPFVYISKSQLFYPQYMLKTVARYSLLW